MIEIPDAEYRKLQSELKESEAREAGRRQAEEELRQSERQFRILFDNAPVGIGVADLKGELLAFNRAMLLPGGYSGEDIKKIGNVALLYYDAKERDEALALFKKKGHLANFAARFKRKDGSPYDALLSLATTFFQGQPCILAIVEDITERRQAEESMKESEEKYRKQFEASLDAIFIADAETGILIDCNRAAEELVGRERTELIGKHQKILHPPEEISGGFSTTFKLHLGEKAEQVLETKVITKSGEIKDVAIKAGPFELKGKRVIQGIFRDVTGSKRAKEERDSRVAELEVLAKAATGRELKMMELEREVNSLLKELGRPARYAA